MDALNALSGLGWLMGLGASAGPRWGAGGRGVGAGEVSPLTVEALRAGLLAQAQAVPTVTEFSGWPAPASRADWIVRDAAAVRARRFGPLELAGGVRRGTIRGT